jgi:hypothetical protein
MTSTDFYRLLAHIVLVIHFAFVAFVVIGLLLTWIGYFLRWKFVRNFYFRSAHILAMAVVLLEALFGVVCPLTTWEDQLRRLGGEGIYHDKTFMQYWIHKIMFYQFEPGTFKFIYSCFFIALLLSFIFVFPELPWRKEKTLPGQPETENDPRDS